MNLFTKFTIKQRSYLNIAISCLGMLTVTGLIIIEFDQLNALNQDKLKISELESSVLQLRRAEKDFFARKDLAYVEQFEIKSDDIIEQVSQLKVSFANKNIQSTSLQNFEDKVIKYQKIFHQIVQTQQIIGLDHISGYYGSLRDAVHHIESLINEQNNDALLVEMLQLRRAEKDFMLRLDQKYLDKFDALVQQFKLDLADADINPTSIEQIQAALKQYQHDFNAFANAYKQQGLTASTGLNGQMRETVYQTEESLAELLAHTNAAIDSEYKSIILNGLISLTIVIIILVIAAYYLARSLTKPLDELCKTINQIRASNDLTIRLDESGNNEISFLSKTFNQLQADFAAAIGYINATTAELDKTMAQLAKMTADTRNYMQEQHTQADMAATAATEMQTTVADIAKNTEAAASNAANTAQLTLQGKQQVDKTVDVISSLADHLNNASAEINRLEDDSRTIGSIIGVIQSIAEQTNLLALNAAIESARAGEQGRGFAVVADEVRNLAMRTQESTKQIESTITQLQNRSTAIVNLIQTCLANGETSVEQAMQANQMLNQIQNEINSISDMSTMIATAVEEQNVVTEEVNQNVVRIRDISDEIYKMSETNTRISQSINMSLTELHQSVDKFKV
ncbi:methyl-accepting chemotaxis protein [Catenovulum sp. 2E275]|uniref:methyl-accepting chemotaxis protein n=1 Tax=Catenovulum sp. 2E275 TaxID=2980497 RepID=UPI0021CF38D5|nr:methyl-accepting chemotaxis protein [Catenovulum sp. 2E275]MCU4676412.1 methyl-accepting chemotaxis protein [Catenovulum sp. 2E275]